MLRFRLLLRLSRRRGCGRSLTGGFSSVTWVSEEPLNNAPIKPNRRDSKPSDDGFVATGAGVLTGVGAGAGTLGATKPCNAGCSAGAIIC